MEVELCRLAIWATDLDLRAIDDALESDIDQLLNSGRINPNAPGEQTLTVLHTLEGEHWRAFFGAIRTLVETIVSQAGGRVDEGTVHLRGWANRVGPNSDLAALARAPQDVHNHSPAFLSAIYYLRVPTAVAGSAEGTFFANPLPHSVSSPAPGAVVEARAGRLVIFPSWVLHGPRYAMESLAGGTRTIIAVDAHLIPSL